MRVGIMFLFSSTQSNWVVATQPNLFNENNLSLQLTAAVFMLLWWDHLCYTCPLLTSLDSTKIALRITDCTILHSSMPLNLACILFPAFKSAGFKSSKQNQGCGHLVVKQTMANKAHSLRQLPGITFITSASWLRGTALPWWVLNYFIKFSSVSVQSLKN